MSIKGVLASMATGADGGNGLYDSYYLSCLCDGGGADASLQRNAIGTGNVALQAVLKITGKTDFRRLNTSNRGGSSTGAAGMNGVDEVAELQALRRHRQFGRCP